MKLQDTTYYKGIILSISKDTEGLKSLSKSESIVQGHIYAETQTHAGQGQTILFKL